MPVVEPEVRTPVARRSGSLGREVRLPPVSPPCGGNGERLAPDGAPGPLSNARLGMLMLLAGETMFFGGLVGAFLLLRLNAAEWPPPLQPRLPIAVTSANTVVLLLSSYTLVRALRAVRRNDRRGSLAWLGCTAFLGILFLAVQGEEWVRLVRFGLTVSSGTYGATFYTVIGVHGIHVLGAVTWLGVVLAAARRGRYTTRTHVSLSCCAMYWHFVVALWPILYVLVYLA